MNIVCIKTKPKQTCPVVLAHAFNFSTQEAETGDLWVQGQFRLHRELQASLVSRVRLWKRKGLWMSRWFLHQAPSSFSTWDNSRKGRSLSGRQCCRLTKFQKRRGSFNLGEERDSPVLTIYPNRGCHQGHSKFIYFYKMGTLGSISSISLHHKF